MFRLKYSLFKRNSLNSLNSSAVRSYARRTKNLDDQPILKEHIKHRANPFREIYDPTAGPSDIPAIPVLGHRFNEKKRSVWLNGPAFKSNLKGNQDIDVTKLTDSELILVRSTYSFDVVSL